MQLIQHIKAIKIRYFLVSNMIAMKVTIQTDYAYNLGPKKTKYECNPDSKGDYICLQPFSNGTKYDCNLI